jgi:hypothetical protein
MARAREIILGAARRHPCSITAIDGATRLDFALILLPSAASAQIAKGAREYAQTRGVSDPKPEDVLFLRGKWAHTILLAAVDPDSPLDSPQPYFDDVAQIERMLDDAAQIHVVQAQKDFQDEHAPIGEGLSPEQFVKLQAACIDELRRGGDPELPFSGMGLRALRSFSAQAVAGSLPLIELLSQLGSSSPDDTKSSPTTAPTSESRS